MQEEKSGGMKAMEEQKLREETKEEELKGGFREGMEGSSTDKQVDGEIEMKSCESSNVAKHGYKGVDRQRETGILAVEFKNGSLYHYYDVPFHLYDEMCGAESIGRFINDNLRNKYNYERVEKTSFVETV